MDFYDFVIIVGNNLHLTLSRMVGLYCHIMKKKREDICPL